jgi:hypothetical protein
MKVNLLEMLEADLQQAFDTVEGTGFFCRSAAPQDSEYTIWNAWDVLTREAGPKADMEFSVATIYGDGGWNRYYVYRDGSVKFSKGHADGMSIERARVAGFEMLC